MHHVGASVLDPICYSRPDGTWASWDPADPPPRTASGEPIFSLENDEGRTIIEVTPQLPESDYRQIFLSTEPYRLGATAEPPVSRPVQIWVVEFCVQKPGCQHDVSAWMANRIRETARKAVVPALLVWIGGWLLGLGARVRYTRWRVRAAQA